MIRRDLGLIAKIKAKKDVVQSITISKRIILATLILGGLLFFGLTERADGVDTNIPTPDPRIVQKQIDHLYNESILNKNTADRWAHARHTHSRHQIGPKTDSLEYERYRLSVWKGVKKRQRIAYKAFLKQQKIESNLCHSAGFPRNLCQAIIRGAELEKKKSWAFDSNLAWIVSHESGFRPCVHNGGIVDCYYRGDRAFGLFQFLGSTWSGVGCTITSDTVWQTRCGIRYIANRYHTPASAKSYWQAHQSY